MSMCKKGVIILFGLALFFSFFSYFIFQNILFEEGRVSILISVPIGIILALLACLYLSNIYDLKTWSPKNPDSSFLNNNGLAWGLVLGALTTGVVTRLLGQFALGFLFVTLGIWLLITIGYIVFHSCRNERSSQSD